MAGNEQRRAQIIDLVRQQGFVSIEAWPNASRSRRRPCGATSTRCATGGAAAPSRRRRPASSVENIAYLTGQILCSEEKRRIAQLVAAHIPDHASLFINIGTTTEEVARHLLQHVGLRVITNNLNVAASCAASRFEVIVAGGVVRARDRGIVGEATIDLIRQFSVDFGIIGISGIDLDGTLLDFDYQEVRVAQAIIANSRQVFLAADHTKFGRNAAGPAGQRWTSSTRCSPTRRRRRPLRERIEAAESRCSSPTRRRRRRAEALVGFRLRTISAF